MIVRTSLRLSATLLLAGQLLYIVITQFHPGGDANNHPRGIRRIRPQRDLEGRAPRRGILGGVVRVAHDG